jgi:hypothetical protein
MYLLPRIGRIGSPLGLGEDEVLEGVGCWREWLEERRTHPLDADPSNCSSFQGSAFAFGVGGFAMGVWR